VANLLLARATTRGGKFADPVGAGSETAEADPAMLVESLILATGGAAVGRFAAWGGLKSLVALMPQNIYSAEAVIG